MFRVRSLLGDAIASNPYRLGEGLAGRSDAGQVLRLLREGKAAGALEAYRAPLLSRSGNMAIQLLRDRLDLARAQVAYTLLAHSDLWRRLTASPA